MTGATPIWIAVAVIVLIAIILVAVASSRRARTAHLQRRFGPEYERTLRSSGDRSDAERELLARETRVKRFHIEELPAGARDRYVEEWRTVQTRFVDEPKAAVVEADQLVENVMRDRGYPIAEFEQRAADISPDHPDVVQNYRAAHAIASRSERGEANTEDLRQAMMHYRALFTDLLGTNERRPS
jgi:hypothetical protein